MATPELPQLKGNVQTEMPASADNVSTRVSEFGNIVQNFTGKLTQYAGRQAGLKEKAQEMVLKTNIDNSMRAFAATSINMFDPKAGLSSFEAQAKDYTEKLTDGIGGQHKDAVKAYATSSMLTNMKPLHNQVIKQAFNQARVSFLESVDSSQKDISQSVNDISWDDLQNHHETMAQPVSTIKGLVQAGTINLSDRPHVKRANGKISTVDSITIEEDGRYIVIPKVAPWGEVLSEKEAIDLYHEEYEHLGVFDNQNDADAYARSLHKSEEAKLNGTGEGSKKRIAPSVDNVQHNINQTLQSIDGAMAAGIIKADQGMKLKKKIITQANDEVLYHKYQLAVDNGQGTQFIQDYAKSQSGYQDAATYARHIAAFKKIENLDLAQHAVSESTARQAVKDNLKNIEVGKASNFYADSLADRAPNLFPAYAVEKQIASLSGGLYSQFTAGTEQAALETYAHLADLNTRVKDSKTQQINESALDTAWKNAQTYFTDLKADPQKFLLESNMLGDIATQQKIDSKNPSFLPDDLKTPNANTLEATITWQGMHGIPSNQASLLTNAQAKEFGGRLLKAEPIDKVKMIQSIQKQYGKYSQNVMQQLIKEGAVPREYGFFTALDPTSGVLPDVVDALTNTQLDYATDQKAAVKARVNTAMNVATEKAHPNVSTTRRVLGYAFQQVHGAVTGREFNAASTNTGLFGTPALFDERGSTADTKLKALTESYLSVSGYKTGELINTIDNTVNKLTNYYIKVRGLSQDDALTQATRAITSQYEMVDYRDNILRLPKHKINYNDVSTILTNTPELVNKVDWKFPALGDYGNEASRTDNINYFKQNIENGHWATDATDSGLIWVNANGVVNKMQNGNPLFVSFESMQKMQRLDLKKDYTALGSSGDALAYANQAYELFKKNNVSFNHAKMGVANSGSEELKQIPDAFSHFEKMSSVAVSRSKEFYNYLFTDMQARQRKAAKIPGVK